MKTRTVAVYPIVAALAKGAVIGNARGPWIPENEMQARWLTKLEGWDKLTALFSPEELQTIASYSADEINTWLKDHGFSIKLEPFKQPDDFGTASIMKVLVKWLNPGDEGSFTVDGQEYESVQMKEGISFSRVEGYANDIVRIHTESGDTVYMTVADRSDLEGLDLLEKVISLSNGDRIFDYEGVDFPMVNHDAEVDISFFKRMGFSGVGKSGQSGIFRVVEAKQQTKFQMNHLGAKAESAVAMSFGLECMSMPRPDLLIHKEFFIWMTRKGMDTPYFAAYIGKDDWKNPGTIA